MNKKDIISNGVDIIRVDRIRKILNKKDKNIFLHHIFNDEEISYFKKTNFSYETIAGYFAVKEAIMKTLGHGIGEVPFKDITISKDKNNKPFVILTGITLKLAQKENISDFKVSIAHEKEYAVAFVIAI